MPLILPTVGQEGGWGDLLNNALGYLDSKIEIGASGDVPITGDPNGVVDGPVGLVARNTEAGGFAGVVAWRKSTGNGTLTGWVPIARVSAAGVQHLEGTGNPNGVIMANIGSTFTNTESGGWNGARKWRKDSGNGTNTGWVPIDAKTGWKTAVSEGDIAGASKLSAVYRRVDDEVEFYVAQGSGGTQTASGAVTLWTPPNGYRPAAGGTSTAFIAVSEVRDQSAALVATARLAIVFSAGSSLTLTAVNGSRHYGHIKWPTPDAWSAT